MYIFGASTNGTAVWKTCGQYRIEVAGFLDNDRNKTAHCGLPVMQPASGDRNMRVVVTSPYYSYDILKQLQSLGFRDIVNISEFRLRLGLSPEVLWMQDLRTNRDKYEHLRAILGDNKSRLVLDAMLRYRETLDLFFPAAVKSDHGMQWFDDDFFAPFPGQVFVDGGAYRGETTIEFMRRNPFYGAVHMFEPSPDNVRKIGVLFPYHHIRLHKKGLHLRQARLCMNNSGEPDGTISPDGNTEIEVDSLDNAVRTPVDFIKLDVEGSEEDALFGAARHIREDHPFLALAAYHKPGDMWRLQEIVAGMGGYSYYLRHYTQFYHETVLYCVPR